jgi:hypothetical protein
MSEATRIVSERISRAELTVLAEDRFGDMVKAVVDVGRRIMAVEGESQSVEDPALRRRLTEIVYSLVAD